MLKLNVMQLKLKDVIDLEMLEGYDTCTVIGINNQNGHRVVSVIRPYIITSDFAYGGTTVTPSIGFEQFNLLGDEDSTTVYSVVRRG